MAYILLIVDNTKITISDSIIGIYELANENGSIYPCLIVSLKL